VYVCVSVFVCVCVSVGYTRTCLFGEELFSRAGTCNKSLPPRPSPAGEL
jgi:hypothetical protein